MSILHTVNKSPFERTALQSCLRFAQSGSAILLLEDGIYGALKGTSVTDLVKSVLNTTPVYALWPDLEARGMQERVIEGIKLIDYDGFVDLTAQHGAVQAWL